MVIYKYSDYEAPQVNILEIITESFLATSLEDPIKDLEQDW